MFHRRTIIIAAIFVAFLAVIGFVCGAEQAQPTAKHTQQPAAVVEETPQPMPNYVAEQPTDAAKGQFGKIIGKEPAEGSGLVKTELPKFAFGIGLLVTILGAVVKLAVIAGLVAVAYFYVKHRRGTGTVVSLDPVDSLVAAFEDVVSRVKRERTKRREEISKFDSSLKKLQKGISHVLTDEE